MKKLSRIKSALVPIILAMCFLGALIIGVPLLLEKIFWATNESIFVTQYILLSYSLLFLVLFGIILPVARWVFNHFKIPMINTIDGFATILLVTASFFPLIVIFVVTLFLLKIKLLFRFRYRIVDVFSKITTFLLGVSIKIHGKRSKQICINPINHTSPLDYLLTAYIMSPSPWNAMAGTNLFRNKKSVEDKFVATSIGKLIRDYSITVDRDDKESKSKALAEMLSELEKGKNVAIFPEGGRTPRKQLMSGILLREFQRGAFWTAWENKIPIQPIVFDWPVIWRGKDEGWWGVHPCRIDIYFLDVIRPRDYDSVESFQDACWLAMKEQLEKSKRIKRYLKNQQDLG